MEMQRSSFTEFEKLVIRFFFYKKKEILNFKNKKDRNMENDDLYIKTNSSKEYDLEITCKL